MALTQHLGSAMAVKFGTIQTYEAAGTIYGGGLVMVNTATSNVGKAVAAADSGSSDTNSPIVVGYALEDASSGDNVRVRRDGKYKLAISSSAGTIGKLAVVVDDATVGLYASTGSDNLIVGRITEIVDSTHVYVDLTDRPLRVANSATL